MGVKYGASFPHDFQASILFPSPALDRSVADPAGGHVLAVRQWPHRLGDPDRRAARSGLQGVQIRAAKEAAAARTETDQAYRDDNDHAAAYRNRARSGGQD